jgi:hypothetical protein
VERVGRGVDTKIFQTFSTGKEKNITLCSVTMGGAAKIIQYFWPPEKNPLKITIFLVAFLWPSKVLLLSVAYPKTVKINYDCRKTLCFCSACTQLRCKPSQYILFFKGKP